MSYGLDGRMDGQTDGGDSSKSKSHHQCYKRFLPQHLTPLHRAPEIIDSLVGIIIWSVALAYKCSGRGFNRQPAAAAAVSLGGFDI